MSLRLLKMTASVAFAASVLTGCATVDLNDMAAPANTQATQAEVNVVERAVTKLKSAFLSKGLVAKTSRKRMDSAAKILLNGLEEKQVTSVAASEGYNATPKPVTTVLADMAFAKQHIVQATKAAEVYLEMAPADRKLRDELYNLETALMASKTASKVFETALNGQAADELSEFEQTVDRLRDVTDEFGERVRAQQAEKYAEALSN